MSHSHNKNILLIMTGSIACYKACTVMSRLKQAGHQIKVVMSPSSLEFVGASTIEGLTGEAPVTDMYARGNVMDHIHLVRWADLILVAPATANYINKIAHGLGDDLLSTLFLAHDFSKPFLLAPAMNTKMYEHPVTRESIQKLRALGVEILETASGVLACGEIGSGRLLEPDLIVNEVEKFLPNKSASRNPMPPAKTPKVLVTAGGTSEPIDDVRVITNRSTGRTAASLADTLIEAGLQVTYLGSTPAVKPRLACDKHSYETFKDLQTQLHTLLNSQKFDFVVHMAAVSDYSVEKQDGKISSDLPELTLHLKRNPKLVNEIKKLQPKTKLIAFKLTSHADEQLITEKVTGLFLAANCDYVVQNDWSEVSRKEEHYRLFTPDMQSKEITGLQNLGLSVFKKILEAQENNL